MNTQRLLLLAATFQLSALGCSTDFCEEKLKRDHPDVDCDNLGSGGASSSSSAATMSSTTSTAMQGSSSTGVVATCIPSDPAWAPDDACGVFVSVGGTGTGTRAAPFGSIVEGVAAGAALGKPVYVSDGSYDGAVALASGQLIYGGLTAGWAFDGALRPTVTAPPDEIPMRLLAGAATTEVHHLKVQATSAEAVGGSSIAMLVEEVPSVLEAVDLVAGDGQDGMASTTPNGDIGPTMSEDIAIAGVDGEDASANGGAVITGPAGPTNPICMASVGGKGGDGGTVTGTANAAGSGNEGALLPAGCAGNCGGVGIGQLSAGGSCMAGGQGHGGDNGDSGVAGDALGIIDTTGYVAPVPGNGTDGQPGQGGGGGGGAMGTATSNPDTAGASGGSGGAGGCGGKGALGGTGGGSSIALVVLGAAPTTIGVMLTVGNGGDGGTGAEGQFGAVGGNPGAAASGLNGSKVSCDGGRGGQGGNGGAGAGGRGGHAIGIAFNGTAPADGFTVLTKGGGGAGGMSPVNGGVNGESEDTLDFVP